MMRGGLGSSLAALWLWLPVLMVDAGRLVSLNTTSDHAHYFVNDLGVNVKDGTLIFDLTSTQDAIIRLSRMQTLNGEYCDVIFGSVGNTAIAVRENCGGCGSVVMASAISLDSVTALSFWMDWTDPAALKVGQGTLVGQSELFTYTWTVHFEVNYITATSYYGNEGQWNFVIDTPPTFITPQPDGSTVVTLPEDSPISSSVLSLSATDDEGDVVTFYLIGSQPSLLSVQGSDVTLEGNLDFETEYSFLITVIACDGKHNVTAAFTLRVADVIDEDPVVTSGAVTSLPEELAVGTEVAGLFSVSDRDAGDTLTYSLEGSHNVFFAVNQTTGTITVQERIDREGALTRLDDLRVKVVDSAGHTSAVDLDLEVDDVNDNRPEFHSEEFTINVTNTTPADTPLLTFTVSDADAGSNGDVNLTLLTSQAGVWLQGADLYVNVSGMTTHAQSIFTVAVQASDGAVDVKARMTAVAFVSLQVQFNNDHPPVWTDPVPDSSGRMPDVSVSEDTAVSSLLLCLSARDDDVGQSDDVTYLMTSAVTGQGQNASDKFFLEPTSGCLKTASVLDSDVSTGGAAHFLLTFRAVDPGSRSAEAELKVILSDVNDNPPVFTNTVYHVQLSCDTPIGSVITSLSASDADPTVNFNFAFSDIGSEFFSLDSITGDVTTKTNVTTAASASTSHVLNIRVTDGGIPEMTSTAAVVVQIDGCSSTSGDSGEEGSDLESTNAILTAACGVLGGGLLLTTVLLFVLKATQPSPVKPLPRETARTDKTLNRWSKRTSLNSSQSGPSIQSRDDTVVTDLTDTSSCGSLQFI
ncbi:protocadherin-9-like [Babylonia areolata]|uniref:protocadherin-9-like n=1 Tax=Babylonia areolata TaxID=304850 RepID=UPI003FCF04FB